MAATRRDPKGRGGFRAARRQARPLQKRQGLRIGAPETGDAFESWLFHELRNYCDYRRRGNIELLPW